MRVELLLCSMFTSGVRTGCIRAQGLVAGDDPLGVVCLHFSFFYIEERSLLIINYDGSYLKYVMILTEQTLIIIV